MEQIGESGRPHVDARGIRPPDAYALSERPAPPGVVLLALEGEFDLATAPAARELFEQAAARRPRAVVLDLAEVTFGDSSALRELLLAHAALSAAGARLIVAAVPDTLLRVLELTRATDLLELTATVDDALERVTG